MITSLPIWPFKANSESNWKAPPQVHLSGGLIFRTLLAAVPNDPAGGEPERVRVVPVSVQFQHLGDDSFHGVLFGGTREKSSRYCLLCSIVSGESGASTRLCPDTTMLGFRAAIASRFAIQACRAASSVQAVIMWTW